MALKIELKFRLRSLKLSSIDLAFFSLSESSSSEIWSSVFCCWENLDSSSSYLSLYFSKYSTQLLFWRGKASSCLFRSAISPRSST